MTSRGSSFEGSPFFEALGEELLDEARRDFAEQRRQMGQFALDPNSQADCDLWEATTPLDQDAPASYEELIVYPRQND